MIYKSKLDIQRAGICHRNTVDSWISKGKIHEEIMMQNGKIKKIGYSFKSIS